jgi:hypothetical protein
MRKLLLSVLAVAVLGTGSAFAQSGFWAGISGGYPGAEVHFGVENVFQGLDLRANVGYSYGVGALTIGADVLYGLAVDTGTLPLDTYVGAGATLVLEPDLFATANLFGGIEYRLAEVGLPEGGIFLEVGPTIRLPFELGVTGRLGFNYHF